MKKFISLHRMELLVVSFLVVLCKASVDENRDVIYTIKVANPNEV